jgi:autotransporter-associated beta strand protein
MNRHHLRVLGGAALALGFGFAPINAQSISTWDGGTNGTGTSWATSANWAGDTLPVNASNTIVRIENANADGIIGGSSSFLSISASRTLGTIVFSNINNKLPSSLNIDANQSGTTTDRTITLHSGITLENTTSTVAFRGNNGTLGIALGANNTFHVADLGAQLSILNNINISGGFSVEKTGAGTLLMGTGSTFSGGLILTEGRLRTNGSSIASGGVITSGPFGHGTLTLRGGILQSFSATTRVYHNSVHLDGNIILGGFAPDGTTLTGTQTFSTLGGGSTTVTGQRTLDVQSTVIWNQTIGGTGGIVKAGNATLTLNGDNTYAGVTTVADGTLVLNGSIIGGLQVQSSGAFTGTGTVSGAATIAGAHNPGNSPGIQTFNDNLTYTTGASVTWELNGNTSTQGSPTAIFDQVVVGGTLDFAGATLLQLTFNAAGSTVNWNDAFWASSQSWRIYDAAAVTNFGNLSLASTNWADSWGNLFDTVLAGSSFSLSQVGGDVYLNYAAIPEPSTYAALFGAAVLGFVIYRRRRSA